MNTLSEMALGYYPELDKNELRGICQKTLAYLLKTADDNRSRQASTDLSNAMKHIGGHKIPSTREYRRDIYANGYVIKNLKLWLWWIASKGLKPRDSYYCMGDFGIKRKDWPLAKLTMTDKRLRARLRKMSRTYEAHTLEQFDSMVHKAVAAADNAIRSYAYNKLRFLEMTRFITNDDLLSELRYHAVLGLTRQYPKIESEEYARNLAGLCARNGGNSVIKEHTKDGNKFLTQNQDSTWDGLILSYDNDMHDAVPMTDFLDPQEERSAASDVDVQDRLAALNADLLVSRYTGKKRTFVTLMLGIENQGFSEYLAEFGLPANHVLFDVMFDDELDSSGRTEMLNRYVGHAASWLGVREKAAWKFLDRLGKDIGAH